MQTPRLILLAMIGAVLMACAAFGPASHGTYTPQFDRHDPWKLRIDDENGRLSFSVDLREREYIRLALRQSDQDKQVAYFELIDEMCEFGHVGRLVYMTEKQGHQSFYFDEETPWGTPIAVELTWQLEEKVLVARVNGSEKRIPLKLGPSELVVSGRNRENMLPDLKYQGP